MYPLAEGLFAPLNQWYVAAWSNEVTRTPMERYILDQPIAFYRKEDGTPVALEGRCPHRGFPLGRSRVVKDDIQCGYHGITFHSDGSCAQIPSQDKIPGACRIKSYPLVERWQWLWIWPGDPSLADESKIPDHFEIGLTDPSFHCAGDSYHLVPGRYMLMHDNLFDLTHIGYLHRDTFGGGGAGADQVPVITNGPDWIESRYEQNDIECPPFFSHLMGYSGRCNRSFGLRLRMPCLHVGSDALYQIAPDGSNGALIGALRVYHAVTPATRHSTHYFFAAGHSWEHEDPHFAQGIVAGLQSALTEDVSATTYIEQQINQSGTNRLSEVLLRADNVCARGRRLFEETIRSEHAQKAAEIA